MKSKHPFIDQMTGFRWLIHTVLCSLFDYRDIVKEESNLVYTPAIYGDVLSYQNIPTLYLRRWYISMKGKTRIFIHHILRSDSDRHLHDHPWDFKSFILWGGYTEELPMSMMEWLGELDCIRKVRPLTLVNNKAEHTHRVVLDKPAWTMVFAKRARREWGFHTEEGWVPWYIYLGLDKKANTSAEDIIWKEAPKTMDM